MKKTLAIFTQLSKRYDITDFYVVTVYGDSIRLQGKITEKNMAFFNLDQNAPINSSNFIERYTRFASININIVLTH
jgi:hypothetical protein